MYKIKNYPYNGLLFLSNKLRTPYNKQHRVMIYATIQSQGGNP